MLTKSVIKTIPAKRALLVVLAQKIHGFLRFFGDHCKLNTVLKRCSYLLRHIEKLPDCVKYVNAFNNPEKNGNSSKSEFKLRREKTLFTYHHSLRQNMSVPFGLESSSTILQQLKPVISATIKQQNSFVYINDIAVISLITIKHLWYTKPVIFISYVRRCQTLIEEICSFYQYIYQPTSCRLIRLFKSSSHTA